MREDPNLMATSLVQKKKVFIDKLGVKALLYAQLVDITEDVKLVISNVAPRK